MMNDDEEWRSKVGCTRNTCSEIGNSAKI
jgi:hypothetical protein